MKKYSQKRSSQKNRRIESANYILKDIFASVDVLDNIAEIIVNNVLSKKEFIEKVIITKHKIDYIFLIHYFDLFIDKIPNEKIEKLDNNSGSLCIKYYKSLSFIKSYLQIYSKTIDDLSETTDGETTLLYKNI